MSCTDTSELTANNSHLKTDTHDANDVMEAFDVTMHVHKEAMDEEMAKFAVKNMNEAEIKVRWTYMLPNRVYHASFRARAQCSPSFPSQ
jgi:predicted transcriptional regulator